jgi:hypothetical protein
MTMKLQSQIDQLNAKCHMTMALGQEIRGNYYLTDRTGVQLISQPMPAAELIDLLERHLASFPNGLA